MIEFWRNLRKSADERRQEEVTAYLDGALSAREQAAFEQRLTADADLQAELEAVRLLKQNLSRLPRRRAPRNFTLDPAVYSKPARQPLFQLYPVLPVATALTAVLFVFLIGLEALSGFSFGADAPAAEAPVALFEEESAAFEVVEDESMAQDAEMVEVTRVVTETVTETVVEEMEVAEEEMEEAAADEAAEEPEAEEEAMEEEMAEEAPAEDAALPPTPSPNPSPSAEGLPPQSGGGIDDATMATVPENGDGAGEIAATALPTLDAYPLPEAAAAVAEVLPYEEVETAVAPDDTVDAEIEVPTLPAERAAPAPERNPLRAGQIGVGVLLFLLLALTLYVRRQR